MQFKKLAFSSAFALLLLGCAGSGSSQQSAQTEAAQDAAMTDETAQETRLCPDMSEPQMCTMEYMPYCGYDKDNQPVKTVMGSMCNVCSEPDVVTFASGECPK